MIAGIIGGVMFLGSMVVIGLTEDCVIQSTDYQKQVCEARAENEREEEESQE